MTDKIDDNIIGFYASFNAGETYQELVKSYLWSDNGLKNKLIHLKWKNYGQDLVLILFEIHVNPIPYARKNLREIGNYRKKEKSIGIPLILDEKNFFRLSENDRQLFFAETILEKLELVKLKVKRNNLDFNIIKLIQDVKQSLNYTETGKLVKNINLWSKLKSMWS